MGDPVDDALVGVGSLLAAAALIAVVYFWGNREQRKTQSRLQELRIGDAMSSGEFLGAVSRLLIGLLMVIAGGLMWWIVSG